MNVDDLNVLLPAPPARPALSALWGFVTGVDPLRVRLDGDAAALPVTPVALVAGLQVGDRVWCMLSGRQLVVLGRSTVPAAPGWITAGFTAASGWTVNMAKYRLAGPLVELRVSVTPTSTKTPGADGNITDETIITIPAGIVPADRLEVYGGTGQYMFGLIVYPDARLRLASTAPSASIPTNVNLIVNCLYHLG